MTPEQAAYAWFVDETNKRLQRVPLYDWPYAYQRIARWWS